MDTWVTLAELAVIETQRLYLRPFTIADSKAFFEMSSDEDNFSFIFPVSLTRKESDYLLTHSFLKEPLGVWAIEDKETGKLVGAIRLENRNDSKKSAEVGYFIHKAVWNKGYATESLKTLTDILLGVECFDHLAIVIHEENLASQRVAQKAGYEMKRLFKGSDRYTKRMRYYRLFIRQRRKDNA